MRLPENLQQKTIHQKEHTHTQINDEEQWW
jgi:hypothetical protein